MFIASLFFFPQDTRRIRGGYTAGPMRNPAPTNESSQLSEQSAQRDSDAETTEEEEKTIAQV